MEKEAKIYIAGHKGMVGSAIHRRLLKEGFENFVLRTRKELDLTNQEVVKQFFNEEKPDYVFLCAAKVGGILANDTYRGQFIYENLMIQSNVIHYSYEVGVKKLLFMGSSCIYPRDCPQPMKEEYLLTGKLEPTNEPYAIAKIAGIKMCDAYRAQYGCDFISVMPTNLYGPNDNYDLNNSHVIPALLRKFHEAKIKSKSEVVVWGTGKPLREFMHVDDLADACYFLMENYSNSGFINIGSGIELSIDEVGSIIKQIVEFSGKITFDKTKPDGTPRKLLDTSKLADLAWSPSISLEEGLEFVYSDFVTHV